MDQDRTLLIKQIINDVKLDENHKRIMIKLIRKYEKNIYTRFIIFENIFIELCKYFENIICIINVIDCDNNMVISKKISFKKLIICDHIDVNIFDICCKNDTELMSKPIINIKHYYDEKSISKTMTIDINHKINELNIMPYDCSTYCLFYDKLNFYKKIDKIILLFEKVALKLEQNIDIISEIINFFNFLNFINADLTNEPNNIILFSIGGMLYEKHKIQPDD